MCERFFMFCTGCLPSKNYDMFILILGLVFRVYFSIKNDEDILQYNLIISKIPRLEI